MPVPSPPSSIISFAIIELRRIGLRRKWCRRKWWNWQTHHLEGVAPKGVGVQIPPSAPYPQRKSMVILITVIHIIVCFFIIIVVLLQSGKSGDVAAAFGGMGSQTAFGPRGAASALSK